MAPNVTSPTTLFMAEAAVCPTATLKSRHLASMTTPRPSMAPVAKPAAIVTSPMSPTATATATLLGGKAKPDPYAWKIVWRNVLAFVYLHYAAIRGIHLIFTGQLHFYTYLWSEYEYRRDAGRGGTPPPEAEALARGRWTLIRAARPAVRERHRGLDEEHEQQLCRVPKRVLLK